MPSLQLAPRAAARMVWRGVRQILPTLACSKPIVQILGTFVTNTYQSTLTRHRHSLPDSTKPLYSSFSPRTCQTLLGRGFPFCLLCPPPASQAQLSWFRQIPLLWEKQALNQSVLQRNRELARRTESWPGEHLPGVGQGAALAPGLHFLHLGSHSVSFGLATAGRY